MYTKLDFDAQFTKGISKVTPALLKIGQDGRLISKDPQGSRNTPWVFVNYDNRKKFCSHWNGIYCLHFGLIPTYCRFSCWKTVVKPRNVKELFECYDIFRALDLPSKIGMDVRDYTFGPWAGFIYADSLVQGKEYYRRARKAIPEEVPIILKRGCTEMERITPSDKWDKLSQRDIYLEEKLNDVFSFDETHFFQAAWLKNEVKERWIKRAIEIGDATVEEVAKAQCPDPEIWNKLVVHSVQYQDVDLGKEK